MPEDRSLKTVAKAIFITTLLVLAAPAAFAQESPDPAQSAVEREAFDRGYREGQEIGDRAGREGREIAVEREPAYRDGDRGYRPQYGDRNAYRGAYRSGFERGYAQAWGRYGRHDNGRHNGWYKRGRGAPAYGRHWDHGRDPAYDHGYRDGYARGFDDGRGRGRFDPVRDKRYRRADAGYFRGYGPIDYYRDRYRDAFMRGYEQGFRDCREPHYRGPRPHRGMGFFFGLRF